LGLLQKGESVNLLEESNAFSLRVLPTLDSAFDMLVTATADYAHLCCEQTAAKILAATFMYLTAKKRAQQKKAEQIILAGIAREKKMMRPGHGFSIYPRKNFVDEYLSRLAVRYLWKLNQLNEIPDISGDLRRGVGEGLSLADQAAEAHQMKRVPERILSIEDAYEVATAGRDKGAAKTFIESLIDFNDSEARLKNRQGVVAARASLAYAAATLIAMGDLLRGVKLANQVTRQFNDQGALYSTLDSVAAIALMIQLRLSGIVAGESRMLINDREVSAEEVAQWNEPINSVEVLEGVAAVEVTRIREEDWGAFAYDFPVKIGFRDSKDKKIQHFEPGDRVDLTVSLPDGYQTGDLVHVALPACMSWIQGGGKVKRFTMDFEGKDSLRIPVVVTSKIRGKQHFAVCVRNMFKEERATSPGVLTVGGY
jgi:hypothetical protein